MKKRTNEEYIELPTKVHKGYPKCSSQKSQCENEILSIISELNPISRDREILKGKEIDIYIPSHKLGLEYHELCWHTEWFGEKDSHYHINKLKECNRKGIKLIQIFEDEYINNKDIVLSKIKHILGLEENKVKIFARKCTVKTITKHQSQVFLDTNHIQGFSSATLYLGLFYDKQLIGVMNFIEESKGKWNLSRFATDINYNCVGAGGKLFKYFIKNYKFDEIKSFADRRWTINTDDNLYTKLGFKYVGFVPPTYTYYNPKVEKYKRFHKFSFRKQTLNKKYGLPLTMTETEMVKELGYDRIWDCGLIKYVYKK